MANIISSDSSVSGTLDSDFIIASGNSTNPLTVNAGNGHDIVLGNHGPTFLDVSDGNETLASGLVIDDASYWTTVPDPTFANAAIPHTSILATGNDTPNYYQITLEAGQTITVDVDFAGGLPDWPGFDPLIHLFDGSGNLAAKNDDASLSAGGLGSYSASDSYLSFTASTSGVYYININNYYLAGGSPGIPAGATYLLNVAVTGHAATGAVGSGPATLNGDDGNDVLIGTIGNDVLNGGAGDDRMEGAGGVDLASYASANSGVTVSLAITGFQDTIGAGVDLLRGVESLLGSVYADSLTGDNGANVLDGGGGSDVLNGGGGNDRFLVRSQFSAITTIDGGAGDADFVVLDTGTAWNVDLATGTGTSINGAGVQISNVEILSASDNSDILGAGAGTTIRALGGSDTVYASTAATQILDGGDDIDTLDLSRFTTLNAALVVNLTTGLSSLSGARFWNFENANGGASADSITGTTGANTLFGFNGNDRLNALDGADTLYGGAGDDTLLGGAGLDYLSGDDGADRLEGGDDADTLLGGANNDTILGGAGNDLIIGGAGDDVIDGGDDIDTVGFVDATIGVSVDLRNTNLQNTNGSGLDTFRNVENVTGTLFGDFIQGSSGANTLNGSGGIDTIFGHGGNDIVNGGDGSDTLDGGAGNDTINGGADVDWANYTIATAGVTVSLAISGPQNTGGWGTDTLVFIESLYGSNFNDVLTGDGGNNGLTGWDGQDRLYGGAGLDTLDGGAGNDRVEGQDGDDILYGGVGNDTILGGAGEDLIIDISGTDVIDGGADYDTLSFSGATAGVQVDLGVVGAQNTGGGGMKTISNIEQVIGSAFDDVLRANDSGQQLVGGDGTNVLTGGSGGDWLIGGDSYDYLEGGAGDDVLNGGGGAFDSASYLGASAGVTVSLLIAGQQDTGGAGKDILIGIERLFGSQYADTLIGDDQGNILGGYGGNDILQGGGGFDQFNIDWSGSGEHDEIDGGDDFDWIGFSSGAATGVIASTVTGTAFDGAGNTASFTGIEQFYGSGKNDILTAVSAFGQQGDDIIRALDGYISNVYPYDGFDGGDGIDTLDVSLLTDSAGAVIDLAVGTIGAERATRFENVIGSAFKDVVTGTDGVNIISTGAGNDEINAGGGDDRIDGGAGADIMRGGTGDDWYYVDNAADAVVEGANAGTADRVLASRSYALGGNSQIEIMTTTDHAGTTAIDLTGNGFVNQLVGNAGANRLDGGGGADVMQGNGGNDTYVVDNAGDVIVEGLNGGTDLVESSVSHVLGANVERLRLTGTADLTGGGNALDNRLFGNDGANVLNGGDGADSLYGRLGADTLVGGAGADGFYFDTAPAAGNIDRITDFNVADDTIYLGQGNFAALAEGALLPSQFVIGAAAGDATDRIIYNSATGALFYDSDGTGAAAQVQFATLTTGLAMTAADFVVI
jgi:Ca2+-binding RTX toxin-like protein